MARKKMFEDAGYTPKSKTPGRTYLSILREAGGTSKKSGQANEFRAGGKAPNPLTHHPNQEREESSYLMAVVAQLKNQSHHSTCDPSFNKTRNPQPD